MKKFQTQWKRHQVEGESSTKPSQTVPDQSMPIIEIMRRYASGLPLGGMKNPVYQGEESGIPPNWDKMDLSEKMDFKEQNLERINDMRQDLQAQANKTGKYKPKESTPKENQQPAPSAGRNDSSDRKDKPE